MSVTDHNERLFSELLLIPATTLLFNHCNAVRALARGGGI